MPTVFRKTADGFVPVAEKNTQAGEASHSKSPKRTEVVSSWAKGTGCCAGPQGSAQLCKMGSNPGGRTRIRGY